MFQLVEGKHFRIQIQAKLHNKAKTFQKSGKHLVVSAGGGRGLKVRRA